MPSTFLPPPDAGWNTFDPVAGMDPMAPGAPNHALTLDNLMPEQGQLRVRPGYRVWASGMSGSCMGLMAYRNGANTRLFATSGGSIYDVTNSGPVGAPLFSGPSFYGWDGVMVSAAGGQFMLSFNGDNSPARVFDGTTWSNWTATGVGVPVGWANVFKGQLYVGGRTALSFWYGAPGAYTGAFTEFPLQGVAKLGGGLAAMATWTLDGGQGIDDYAVFFTTEGEALVYRGTNPSNPATFALVGTFNMPKLVDGFRCVRQFGGDVLVLTVGGVFSLRMLLSGVDAGTLPFKAYTRKIEATFLTLVQTRVNTVPWDLVTLPSRGIWMVNACGLGRDTVQLAFRSASGAASRLTRLPATCWIEAFGRCFFGAAGGKVMLWGEDVTDDGAPVPWEAVQAFSSFGASGQLKRFTLLEPVIQDQRGCVLQADVALDWRKPVPGFDAAGPGAAAQPMPAFPLGGFVPGDVTRQWRGVQGLGMAGAVRLRGLSSANLRPGWLGTGIVWETGGPLR